MTLQTLPPFDDETLAFEFDFSAETPFKYVEIQKVRMRHGLATRLVDRLASQPYLGRFFVIDFMEDVQPLEYGSGKYRIFCHVSEVATRQFVMAPLPNYHDVPTARSLSLSAIEELGYRFRRAVRKVAKTIFKKQGDM
jgi:hypothetical protein